MGAQVLSGFIGSVFGALITATVQWLVAGSDRKSAIQRATHESATIYLARAQRIFTEYRMLAWRLEQQVGEHSEKVNYEVGEEGDDIARELFTRGLDAWKSFRDAGAAVNTSTPQSVRIAGERMITALNLWVDPIDNWFIGRGRGQEREILEYQADRAMRVYQKVVALTLGQERPHFLTRCARCLRRLKRVVTRSSVLNLSPEARPPRGH